MDDFTKQLLDQFVHNAPDGDGDGGVSKVIELLVFKKDEKFLGDFTGLNIPIKPTWPYKDSILTVENDETESVERKKDISDLISHKSDTNDLPIMESSILRRLVHKSHDIVKVDAEYANFVRKSVKSLIDNSLIELKDKYLMYKDSFLVEVGSMAEGTRIIEPSEMDFLIALPELANEQNCNLYFTEAILSMFIQDDLRKEMRSWIKKNPAEERIPGFRLDSLHPFYFLRGTLELAIKNNIPDGMSFLTENKKHEMSRTNERAQARSSMFHFGIECTGHSKLFISVDLCFSIPLDTQRIDKIVIENSIDATYLKFIQNMCSERSTLVCAVMNSSHICVLADRYHFVKYVTKFNEHEDAKNCYKMAKYVIQLFLPWVEEDDCFICSKSIIPSYAIKTIIFYMMDFYKDPNNWNEENIGNRLIEVFDILLYSQFTLKDHICYLWRKIDIPNQSGPFKHIPKMENAIKFLATEDEHILRKVSKYWHLMETKTDSKELIKQFLDLLKCLRDSDD